MKAKIEFEDFDNHLKEIIREVLQEELIKLRGSLLPYISDEEQRDIEETYKKPSEEKARTIESDL